MYSLPVVTDNFLLPAGPIMGTGGTLLSQGLFTFRKAGNYYFIKAYVFKNVSFEIQKNISKFE